jgi:hypothetical protein
MLMFPYQWLPGLKLTPCVQETDPLTPPLYGLSVAAVAPFG